MKKSSRGERDEENTPILNNILEADRGHLNQLSPDTLSRLILDLCGSKTTENINKESLLAMGPKNMAKMLSAFLRSELDPNSMDNRTPLAKFNSYAEQINRGDEPGPKTDKDFLGNLKNNLPEDKLSGDSLPKDPNHLADLILSLAGLKHAGGFVSEETMRQYPHMNKASLVKLGPEKMTKMLLTLLTSENDRYDADNRTRLAKLSSYMEQILDGKEPGPKIPDIDSIFESLKEINKDFNTGPK